MGEGADLYTSLLQHPRSDSLSGTSRLPSDCFCRHDLATGLSVGKVVKQLQPTPNVTITINGTTQRFPRATPYAQCTILAGLGSNRRVLIEMSKLRTYGTIQFHLAIIDTGRYRDAIVARRF